MAIEEQLDAVFVDVMPNEAVAVRERTQMNSASWDSMCQLNLIISIEQEFGITLADQDAVDLNSYQSALAILGELGVV